MQEKVNEIPAKDLSVVVELVSGERSSIKYGRKLRFLIPGQIRNLISAAMPWTHIEYQGLVIDHEKTNAERAVNVVVAKDGTRIIF